MTTKRNATTTSLTACLGTMLLLASCSSSGGSGGTSGAGGSSSTGGASATGGSNGAGGSSSTGGTNGSGTGGSNSTGGANGTGGVSATGGSNGAGGSSSTGGSNGAGGSNASGGRGGSSATGGTTGAAGSSATGGTTGAAGAPGTVDQGGVKLAKPCDSISTSKGYLNLGDMRLINNRWGSDALGCSGSMYKVYVNCDSTLGWDFSRPACGGMRGDPDFPEVEFGVAPFGTGSSLLTSPSYSSTTLLPIQLKNLNSASVSLTNLSTTFTNPSYYDTNYEFWISKLDPRTNADAQVYAEIIMFLGWEANRNNSSAGGWTCDKSGTVTSGGQTYNLCHQSDSWSSGHWRFFNFNINNGPDSTFSGTGDVKAILNWITQNYSGFSTDYWLTRIEVGTEIDDSTAGSAKISKISFEINGTTKTATFAQ